MANVKEQLDDLLGDVLSLRTPGYYKFVEEVIERIKGILERDSSEETKKKLGEIVEELRYYNSNRIHVEIMEAAEAEEEIRNLGIPVPSLNKPPSMEMPKGMSYAIIPNSMYGAWVGNDEESVYINVGDYYDRGRIVRELDFLGDVYQNKDGVAGIFRFDNTRGQFVSGLGLIVKLKELQAFSSVDDVVEMFVDEKGYNQRKVTELVVNSPLVKNVGMEKKKRRVYVVRNDLKSQLITEVDGQLTEKKAVQLAPPPKPIPPIPKPRPQSRKPKSLSPKPLPSLPKPVAASPPKPDLPFTLDYIVESRDGGHDFRNSRTNAGATLLEGRAYSREHLPEMLFHLDPSYADVEFIKLLVSNKLLDCREVSHHIEGSSLISLLRDMGVKRQSFATDMLYNFVARETKLIPKDVKEALRKYRIHFKKKNVCYIPNRIIYREVKNLMKGKKG